jgi:hypothetical protein
MKQRPAKPRNRARIARDHFKYSVQWLIALHDGKVEDPQCCAAFKTLKDAEWMAEWLRERGDPEGRGFEKYYGIEIIPL